MPPPTAYLLCAEARHAPAFARVGAPECRSGARLLRTMSKHLAWCVYAPAPDDPACLLRVAPALVPTASGRSSTTATLSTLTPPAARLLSQGFFDPLTGFGGDYAGRFRHRRRLPRHRSPKPRRPALGRLRRVPIRARERRNGPHPAEPRIGRGGVGVSAYPRARVRPPRTSASSRCATRRALTARVRLLRGSRSAGRSTVTASGSLSARWAPPRVDRGERSRVRDKPEHLYGEAVESRLLALALRPQLAS